METFDVVSLHFDICGHFFERNLRLFVPVFLTPALLSLLNAQLESLKHVILDFGIDRFASLVEAFSCISPELEHGIFQNLVVLDRKLNCIHARIKIRIRLAHRFKTLVSAHVVVGRF